MSQRGVEIRWTFQSARTLSRMSTSHPQNDGFHFDDMLQYQLALFQIDSMRKDGKFIGADGSIPEGQGIVMAHLNECHELVEMVSDVFPRSSYVFFNKQKPPSPA